MRRIALAVLVLAVLVACTIKVQVSGSVGVRAPDGGIEVHHRLDLPDGGLF